MGVISSWRQREVLAEIAGRVVQGMERACQFAAEQAKGKCSSNRVRKDITHEVTAHGNTITGRVGVKRGSKGFFALWLEMGTGPRTRRRRGSTGTMPARPFLRPAVFGNRDRILRLIGGGR